MYYQNDIIKVKSIDNGKYALEIHRNAYILEKGRKTPQRFSSSLK